VTDLILAGNRWGKELNGKIPDLVSIIIEAFIDDKERLQDLDRMVMPSGNSACYLPVTVCLLDVTKKYHVRLLREKIFLLFEGRR